MWKIDIWKSIRFKVGFECYHFRWNEHKEMCGHYLRFLEFTKHCSMYLVRKQVKNNFFCLMPITEWKYIERIHCLLVFRISNRVRNMCRLFPIQCFAHIWCRNQKIDLLWRDISLNDALISCSFFGLHPFCYTFQALLWMLSL